MKKIISFIVSGILLVSTSANAFADMLPYDNVDTENDNSIVSFIIEMEGEPVLSTDAATELGTDYLNTSDAILRETQLQTKHNRVINKINRLKNSNIKVDYTYTTLFNGLSVSAPMSMMHEFEQLPDVKQVYISRTMYADIKSATAQTHSLPSDTYESTESPGYTGAGQVVAVIDTEFQLDHKFFANAPSTLKLTKDEAEAVRPNTYFSGKIPYAYDYAGTGSTEDLSGAHGTHVAGIVAGSGGSFPSNVTDENYEPIEPFSGVAPDAQLVLMKAGTGNGALNEKYILAAMEDAIKLKVCAINMSFGAVYTSPLTNGGYETSLTNARNAGITINVSAGNSGIGYNTESISATNSDYSSSGSPDTYSSVTSVASADNLNIVFSIGQMKMSDETNIQFRNAFTSSAFDTVFYNNAIEYVDCGYGQVADFSDKDVEGKIALIQRGGLTFTEKSNNAKNNGAVGIILYDPENFSGTTVELSLPSVFISYSDAQKLISAETKTITVTRKLSHILKDNPNGGQISTFSSWGVSESLELKPDITAPGGNIYSSYPSDTASNEYAYMSGTSMSAPHITGITALMCEYLERNNINLTGVDKVLTLENMLMSSAEILMQPNSTIPYSPRLQGAGMVNTANAMKSPVVIIGDNGKTKLSLGEVDDTLELEFTLKNLSNAPVTYNNISLQLMMDDYYNYEGEKIFIGKSHSLNIDNNDLPDTVTVPANGEISLTVSVTPDKAELTQQLDIFTNGFFIDGFVVFDNDTNPQISIPFTGFYGGWSKMSVFDKTMYDEDGSLLNGKWDINCYGTYLLTNVISDDKESFLTNGITVDGTYDKDRIAISPNDDGIGDELGIRISLMRPVKNMTFTLTNNDDSDVQRVYNYNRALPKYHSSKIKTVFSNTSADKLPDGEYTLKVAGTYAYDGASENSFELPVTVDREKPVINNAELSENKLSVTATDNNYINYIGIGYVDSNNETAIQTEEIIAGKGEASTVQFDVFDIDPETISIFVMDNAYNAHEAALDNFTGNVTTPSISYSSEAVAITATNTSSVDIEGDAILAFYDDDKRFITSTYIPDISLAKGTNDTYIFTPTKDTTSATLIKMFIWDSIATLKPLDIVKTFTNFK